MSVPLSGKLTLTSGFQTALTVYDAFVLTLKMVHLVNTSAVPVTVQLCYVPKGGVPAADNAALWDYSIPAHDFLEFGEGHQLDPGTTIQALASADNVVNLFASGTED